ncbi:MAG: hypothetical protein V7731_14250 [Amphritea sp.]
MRSLLLIALTLSSGTAMAVTKQDIQDCQRLAKPVLISQCVQRLKSPILRRQVIACKKDLTCWANYNRRNAQKHCATAFTRVSLRDRRWANLWDGEHLTHGRWLSKKSATLLYYRDIDRVRIQCRYNPDFPTKAGINYMTAIPVRSGIELKDPE